MKKTYSQGLCLDGRDSIFVRFIFASAKGMRRLNSAPGLSLIEIRMEVLSSPVGSTIWCPKTTNLV